MTFAKVASVGVSLIGVILFFVQAYNDAPSGASNSEESCGSSTGATDTVFGIILLLLFTIYYSAYSILYKKTVDSKEISVVSMHLSAIAMHNSFILWIILLIPASVHMETLSLPSLEAIPWLFALMAVATIGNFSLMFGYSVTSPLYFTVGMVISIPLAMLWDSVREGHNTVGLISGLGTILICAGFVIMLLEKPEPPKNQNHLPLSTGETDSGKMYEKNIEIAMEGDADANVLEAVSLYEVVDGNSEIGVDILEDEQKEQEAEEEEEEADGLDINEGVGEEDRLMTSSMDGRSTASSASSSLPYDSNSNKIKANTKGKGKMKAKSKSKFRLAFKKSKSKTSSKNSHGTKA